MDGEHSELVTRYRAVGKLAPGRTLPQYIDAPSGTEAHEVGDRLVLQGTWIEYYVKQVRRLPYERPTVGDTRAIVA